MKRKKEVWKDLLLNAGLSGKEFDALRPDILEENRSTLEMMSLVAAVMYSLLIIVNLIVNAFARVNEGGYIAAFAVTAVLYFATRYVLPSRPKGTMPAMYFFALFTYGLFMYLSLLHSEVPAVSFVVFLLVMPLLILDRTITLICMTAAASAVFCVLTWHFKAPAIAIKDIWNVASFALVSMVVTTLMNATKVKSLYQAAEILYLSRTDILTGVRNRNWYEKQIESYPASVRERITCVFADVNGLHEVNNRDGHAAGDAMLRSVAHRLIDCFGEENCFRIGGDEFVAFRTDTDEEVTAGDIAGLKETFRNDGYYVSFGAATEEKEGLDLSALITEAERRMYEEKKAYYTQTGRDRRGRS